MPQPIVTATITYRGPVTSPSLLNLTLASSPFGTGPWDAWCADTEIELDRPAGPITGPYTVTLDAAYYSSYDLAAIQSAFPTVQNWGNLDEVNWLLNQNYVSKGYTSGDVQAAIWTLLGDAYIFQSMGHAALANVIGAWDEALSLIHI